MDASIVDLRKNTKAVLEALDRNETVTILYRGKKRGRLVPLTPFKKKKKASEHPAFGMWRERFDDKDVPGVVRQMRKSRFDAV